MSSQHITDDGAAFARTSRILVGSLMGALPMILVVVTIVLASTEGAFVFHPVPAAIQVAAGLAAHFTLDQIGYRSPALASSATGTEAATEARVRWQSATLLRFAVCEAIALASVVAAFVLEGGFFILLGGVVVSLLLMAVHVWPRPANVDRLATSLEADGARSGLREAFGHSPEGPIQRL